MGRHHPLPLSPSPGQVPPESPGPPSLGRTAPTAHSPSPDPEHRHSFPLRNLCCCACPTSRARERPGEVERSPRLTHGTLPQALSTAATLPPRGPAVLPPSSPCLKPFPPGRAPHLLRTPPLGPSVGTFPEDGVLSRCLMVLLVSLTPRNQTWFSTQKNPPSPGLPDLRFPRSARAP